MGEIADEHADMMYDNPGYGLWFGGHRSQSPACYRCKAVCTWAKRKGKWVLLEKGKPHKCPVVDVLAGEFPAISR